MAEMTETETSNMNSRRVRAFAFIVMLLANSIQSFIFCVPPPLLPAMARAFNWDHQGVLIAQFVTPIAALGMMAGAAFSGIIIARTGPRNMILMTCCMIAVFGGVPILTSSAVVLLASRLLLGFVSALLLTCSTLLVVQNYTADIRPRMIGYQVSFSSVILVVFIFLSATILHYSGWRAPFAIYPAFGIILFILSWVSVPRHLAGNTAEEGADSGNLIVLLWPIYITMLLLGVVVTIPGVQLPFVLVSHGISSPIVQSLIIGTSTIFSAFTGFSYGYIQASIGRRWTLGLSLAGAGIGLIVFAWAASAPLAGAGSAFVGLGQGIFSSYMIALTVLYAPRGAVGRAVGYAVAALFLGSFLDPFLMGILKIFFGSIGAFIAAGLLTLAGALACLLIRRGMLIGIPKSI